MDHFTAIPPQPVPAILAEPTSDEKTMATLAHALQVVGWWIAPLIIFLLKKDSRFVKFHALQALILQVCIFAGWIVAMAAFMGVMFATMPTQGTTTANQAPPTALFIVFPLVWLFGMGAWVLVIVLAIVYAVKAGKGEWADYPVIGGVSRRLLHF